MNAFLDIVNDPMNADLSYPQPVCPECGNPVVEWLDGWLEWETEEDADRRPIPCWPKAGVESYNCLHCKKVVLVREELAPPEEER